LNKRLYGPSSNTKEADDGEGPELAVSGIAYELFVIDPALVSRVLPNVQGDLVNDDSGRRRAATRLIGKLLAHYVPASFSSTTRAPLTTTHPLLLDLYLGRFDDADDGVRLAALDGAAELLKTAAALGTDTRIGALAVVRAAEALLPKLDERSLDPSEAVRLRVVEVAANVASDSAGGLQLLATVLQKIFSRIWDKRAPVREACAEALSCLYAKHALPAWIEGRFDAAESLTWVPQLLCKAFSISVDQHLGRTAQLEEHIERHILGCSDGLNASQRALALLGFCVSASGDEAASRGLGLLLGRKREANLLMRHFLRPRIAKARSSEDAPGPTYMDATTKIENVGRMLPSIEDSNAHIRTFVVHLRSLDAVRDCALWKQLDRLTDPAAAEKTEEMGALLSELDRLLRVHRLTELAPLLRRALLSTWLLPDQVPTFLEAWSGTQVGSDKGQHSASPLACAARRAVADLSRYFPDAFSLHVGAIVQHLPRGVLEDAQAALRSLAALGRRRATVEDEATHSKVAPLQETDCTRVVGWLLEAAETVAVDVASRSSTSRKVLCTLRLFSEDQLPTALEQIIGWAEKQYKNGTLSCQALALHLVAAWLEQSQILENVPQVQALSL
jgi:hypothetical protein